MIVIAQRQLRGAYGLVAPGDKFDAPEDVAKVLLQRGLVTEYAIKAIVTSEKPSRTSRRSNKAQE